ncbi:BNR-4 repeat-containing protein [Seonamhaeicola aphaedonensis]|uniref:Putative secreted protein (Por secretion system target) n=1 Tax=Seonamhaeicola aphaedonensis TaxID=1461338 RepID=A0A3D9HED6_9FLAO|nr:BNR-4 repeat-containing protein [Seonamhaeicola aphaedonensis]RED47847.1 putative secreted protein (Por secretion system target) [Seonamhaeicola aphaedonensis]
MKKNCTFQWKSRAMFFLLMLLLSSSLLKAQVVLETEVKISDFGLHFNGSKVTGGASNPGDNAPYDYFFGRNISAHGDAVKSFGNFVFMTWYRGPKADRHLMLSRYNKSTGVVATIEFPHRHTGYQNRYWIGESHNTCAVGISPKDGTIHLLYDMHAYSATRPSDGSLANDYFRYSYSVPNAATVADNEFTLDKFVKDNGVDGDYKHLRTPGSVAQSEFVALTYPSFFLNDEGDLLFFMREGGNNNGMYKFSKYDAASGTWGNFIDFNRLNARSQPGITYNWGLYGDIKYANGKIRIGFQRRSSNNNDKYEYQNGIYYAYSDDPSGATGWKNYKGEPFDLPLWDADVIKVMEPGDYVATTQANKVHIVGNFDWTVTDNGDVHFISRVRDNENNVTKYLHTYQPSGTGDFITSEDFSGGSALYTSGNDVYLIGLSNGRVFVDKTEGGTNNFQRVYHATSGKTFDHGVINIKDGKVYYYLMEDTSGSAMPLYLQIIDLGIVPQDPLAANNFTIESVGETCADKNNGKLIITGHATHDYTTTINGVAYDFTKELTVENLTPGTYEFCIDVVGENYSHCYEVTIAGGASLSGKIEVVKKSANVSVTSGTGPYKVYKNGLELFETHQTNFTIAVEHGDEIQVKSKEACQGKMTKTINLLEDVKAYPNPSNGLFELYIPNDVETLNLEVYNIQSQLIKSKTYRINNGKVSLDLTDSPNGIYFVRMNLEKPVFTKLIKK